MHTTGKVTLIGAGPGDPDLITLKAIKALQQAEVVLVDDLVNQAVLAHCPRARIVPVGKRGGCQSTPQHFINRMLVALAEQGQNVVRLKGGDPFVFGRGGEEMLALRSASIPYDIIPGITSGLAACSSLEVPATHRGYTHGVTLVTAHTQNGESLPWRALVESNTTLVIYMGMQHLATISRELITAGMAKEMPCMIVENATRDHQRAVTGSLQTLPMLGHQHQMQSPAMIVVGEVVGLANSADTLQMLGQFEQLKAVNAN
ncbi:uroporphyrinogen-III C-methyltransferase [Methylophilus rhizosphaerae]|uniref:uroporphyrinogen-III C-methyltransferase n=1 Tax=Methylophilus rhizosphaerae TaxID=492660 RepID=A0A1G9BRD1_9PROT|nr:uroporphyrinogen-III C-methyltransferase [Methylophilus rhizosphaerae]SDK41724.1 uroporphyrinogen-III C-methyltransferase [Methylophilus rhizosphaerae]